VKSEASCSLSQTPEGLVSEVLEATQSLPQHLQAGTKPS
jgi:hypothetical protein